MTEPAIEIKDLRVEFKSPKGAVRALDGLNLLVNRKNVFGFLGPNGAGKTTTIHTLLGFVPPTSGQAHIFGEDVRKSIARQHIGYLPEHPQLYPFLSGRELLRMSGNLFDLDRDVIEERSKGLLEQVGLEDAADRRISTYSRGMMQRIGLAQALINDPDLVILDEPTSGLDPIGRMDIRWIIAFLRDRGKTVFFSSHELSEVETVCDEVAIISKGMLLDVGKLSDLMDEGESLEKFFFQTVRGKRKKT